MSEKKIVRIVQYEIPLGNWTLKLSKLLDEEFVEFALHWKGKDIAKHNGRISIENFQYMINDLLDHDNADVGNVMDDYDDQ